MPVKLTDKVYTESGAPVQGAVAQAILTNGTTTAITATDTTDANGVWAFDTGIAGHQPDLADPGVGYWYDVRISSGMQYRLRYGAIKAMMSMVYLAQTIVIAAGQKLDTSVAALQVPARTSDQPTPGAGQMVFRTDTKALRVHDGTSWYSLGLPVGSVVPYAGSSVPPGYLFCDGTPANRTTYAALFSVLGTTYGAGDGSTTFGLPDLRGRAPIGVGTGTGLTARALAATGGEEAHVETNAEVGAHTHTLNTPAHTHGITDIAHSHAVNPHSHNISSPSHGHPFGNGPLTTTQINATSGSTYNVQMTSGGGQNTGVATASPTVTQNAGSTTDGQYTGIPANTVGAASGDTLVASPTATAQNNMQPWLAMNWIIKTT